jgi:hypothetical protein
MLEPDAPAWDTEVDPMKRYIIYIISVSCILLGSSVWAGEADVLTVKMHKTGSHRYSFSARVVHEDEGWHHYADKWEILSPDGSVLAKRTLYHPHVGEQPFTRSLSDVVIPEHMQTVTIRAHCSVHGFGGQEITLKLK